MTKGNGRRPSKEWFDGLDDRSRGKFLAAVAILENTIASGRPPAGRASVITTSSEGLSELRVTKKGSNPPHLRVAYLRDKNTLWAAIGFTKQSNELKRKDIKKADSIAADWRLSRERA